jgi:protein AFG1
MNALATHYGSSTTTTPTKRLFQKWWNSETITTNDIIAYFISLGRILLDPSPPAIKGVYIYGDVGVGKSMIMDLFHNTVVGTNMQQQQQQNTTFVDPASSSSSSSSPVIRRRRSSSTITSRRCHFHEFMIDIHTRIHQYKVQYPKSDPIPPIAASIASETTLLCLDEMQVTDIADAMILRRLFTILFQLNVILVTTSNRPPNKLYEGGINRASFVPFIDIIQDSMVVVGMNGVIDYRKEEMEEDVVIDGDDEDDDSTTSTNTATTNSSLVVSAMSLLPRYICPSIEPSPTIRQQFVNDWFTTTGVDTNNQSETIPVAMGRYIHITKSNTNCAILTFDEVCNKPLGAADYIALATRYEIIILTNVPQLDGHVYNQARRFVTFIDALYEAKTILILDANVNREELFVGFNACITTNDGDEEIALDDDSNNNEDGHNNSSTKTIKNEEIVIMREGGSSSSSSTTFITSPNRRGEDGRVEWSATGRIGVSLAQLSSVREVSFSFARADSRLAEMCTSSWGRYVNK